MLTRVVLEPNTASIPFVLGLADGLEDPFEDTLGFEHKNSFSGVMTRLPFVSFRIVLLASTRLPAVFHTSSAYPRISSDWVFAYSVV